VQELQAHPNSREVKVYSILDDLEQLVRFLSAVYMIILYVIILYVII